MALATVAGKQFHPGPRTAGNQKEAAFRRLGEAGKMVCVHGDGKIEGWCGQRRGLCWWAEGQNGMKRLT